MTATPDSSHSPFHLVQPPATKPPYTAGRATVAGLLGLLGAVVLAGGTGFAYAASTDVVESGYLTVVDERASSSTSVDDCADSPGPVSIDIEAGDH
jgi:hypothetical protein